MSTRTTTEGEQSLPAVATAPLPYSTFIPPPPRSFQLLAPAPSAPAQIPPPPPVPPQVHYPILAPAPPPPPLPIVPANGGPSRFAFTQRVSPYYPPPISTSQAPQTVPATGGPSPFAFTQQLSPYYPSGPSTQPAPQPVPVENATLPLETQQPSTFFSPDPSSVLSLQQAPIDDTPLPLDLQQFTFSALSRWPASIPPQPGPFNGASLPVFQQQQSFAPIETAIECALLPPNSARFPPLPVEQRPALLPQVLATDLPPHSLPDPDTHFPSQLEQQATLFLQGQATESPPQLLLDPAAALPLHIEQQPALFPQTVATEPLQQLVTNFAAPLPLGTYLQAPLDHPECSTGSSRYSVGYPAGCLEPKLPLLKWHGRPGPGGTTHILVTDSFLSREHYIPLANHLRLGRECDVICVQLPSTQDPGTPPNGLSEDTAKVREAVLKVLAGGRSAIVVAHGYAGCPVNNALEGLDVETRRFIGADACVRGLIFLNGLPLLSGITCLQQYGGEVPAHFDLTLIPGMAVCSGPAAFLFQELHEAEPDDAAFYAQFIRPQSWRAYTETTTFAAYAHIPSFYLTCKFDRALPRPYQQALFDNATAAGVVIDVVSWDTDHTPFLGADGQRTADYIARCSKHAIVFGGSMARFVASRGYHKRFPEGPTEGSEGD